MVCHLKVTRNPTDPPFGQRRSAENFVISGLQNLAERSRFCHMQMTEVVELEHELRVNGELHLRIDEAAEVLDRSPRQVIRYMNDGKLTRVHYDSRSVCIPASEVEALAEELPKRADGDRPGGAPRPQPKPGDGPPKDGAS